MKYRAITETGSVYEVDALRKKWSKNGGPEKDLNDLRSGFRGSTTPVLEWPQVTQPKVAENLFILDEAEGLWVVTTPVVKVEELFDLEDTIRGGIE